MNQQVRTAKEVRKEIDSLELQLAEINITKTRLENTKKKLISELNTLNNLENTKIVITDHALLRYLERVYNLDLENLRKEILNQRLREYITKFPTARFTLDGNKVVVENKKIITIYPA